MASKPDTKTAMKALITEIRSAIAFDTPIDRLCDGPCTGCSRKLLEYLDMTLAEKEALLAAGYQPALGEITRLKKKAVKIHSVLTQNGLIKAPDK